jgi:hypothetical protein
MAMAIMFIRATNLEGMADKERHVYERVPLHSLHNVVLRKALYVFWLPPWAVPWWVWVWV